MRDKFEFWVLRSVKQTRPWSPIERSSSGDGYLDLYTQNPWSPIERSSSGDGYLDLYTQKKWEGWQAALEELTKGEELNSGR
jgi:hypothetical protein